MTTGRYLLFALFAFISFCVLSAVQYRMRKRSGIALRILSAVIKFLAATATAYSIISTDSWMAWNAGLFFAALYAVLLGDAASDILCLICLEKTKRIDSRASQMIISAVCTLALLLYGTVNMQVVSPNYFTVGSEKLSQSYKAVFLADLHVGSSQSMATTEKTIRKAAAESPDIVILGGDITDEFTTKEEMERTFELLGELEVPMYYIYGNHDRQPNHEKAIGRTYSDEELRSALDANGIIVLEDEWVAFSDDLILMGRDDVSTGVDRIRCLRLLPPWEDRRVCFGRRFRMVFSVQDRSPLPVRRHYAAGEKLIFITVIGRSIECHLTY